MRVFITGVAGFMGSHLADKLIANGEDVVGVDNLVGGTLDNVNPQVEFYEEDCDNLEKMTEYMKGCEARRKILCKRFSTKVKNGAGKQGEFWPESLDYRKPWRSERYARRHGVNASLAAVAY